MQVVTYGKKQFYDAHHDFFDASTAFIKQSPGFETMMDLQARDRFATVFMYLSTTQPRHGGSTFFPKALSDQTGLPLRGLHPRMSHSQQVHDCEQGVKVNSVKGNVLLFYSQTPDGALDPLSQHGGCEVTRGEKWAANLWIWNRAFVRSTLDGKAPTVFSPTFYDA
jgi:prolyl 4-hydroxylase